MTTRLRLFTTLVTLSTALVATTGEARACGCFANPPAVTSSPAIQAGEKILFSVDSGIVTAAIQIAFTGQSQDFGWLLPLPSVPTLEAGSDEVFAELERRTTPSFTLTRTFNCRTADTACVFGGGASAGLSRAVPEQNSNVDAGSSPLVIADSVGPYDYAVLKADDKSAMIDWLAQNRFVVPATSDKALVPYLHPGAYFLALKLKSGKTTGDIQPVVVHYASDLPMIPITLTSIGATEHMGILVWVLGNWRAIPRNYHHTVLDEAALDWSSSANYEQLLIRAVAEAPDHHTFVTEFAGPTAGLNGLLARSDLTEKKLAALADPLDFAHAVNDGVLPYPFTGTLKAILAAYIAEPTELIKDGVSSDVFYAILDRNLDEWRRKYPGATPIVFDAAAAAKEVMARVVAPRNAAHDAFVHFPYLTRMHTSLSPSEMTADPVFSFNPSLPDVASAHNATLDSDCDTSHLVTGSGTIEWPSGARPASADQLPASLRIETLRENGAPEVLVDNSASVGGNAGGCTLGESRLARGYLPTLLLCALALLAIRRRRYNRAP